MDTVVWECTDCALGEIKPCRFEGLREYADTKAISCPYGTHGEDAQWRIASVGMQWGPMKKSFDKDEHWYKMKAFEKEWLIDKHPDFYQALRKKAQEIELDIGQMFLEDSEANPEGLLEYDNEIAVHYYPYGPDWTLMAVWDTHKKELVEFSYEDNGNIEE
jgi:hypothetical protein